MVENSDWQTLSDEALSVRSLITFAMTLGPLAICYLCCLPWYFKAFHKNLAVNEIGPLLPLFNHISRTLKFICPSFFISAIVSGICCFLPASMVVFTMCAIIITLMLSYMVYSCTAMYQMWITSITIHRFINHRQRLTQQRNLTCQNVLKILHVLVTHAKVIGASKIVLFIIAGISHVAGIQNILAIIHFCFIEMFLVLVVIEITEILSNPNAYQQSNNVNGPGESVSESNQI
ncbi:unnamed protein product [Caenorhabditis brenneri]